MLTLSTTFTTLSACITRKSLKLFQPSAVFHIETSHFICSANQVTGFYMECNTWLKWINRHQVLQGRSHWKSTKHVAASKLYNNKLAILNAASFCVSMSPRLPLQTFRYKLGSEVKISGKPTSSRKPCFSKLTCRKFLCKTSSLYFVKDSYTSKNMFGTKNVRYGGIFKASKKPAKSHIFQWLRKPKFCRYYFGNLRYNINGAWFVYSKLDSTKSIWLLFYVLIQV